MFQLALPMSRKTAAHLHLAYLLRHPTYSEESTAILIFRWQGNRAGAWPHMEGVMSKAYRIALLSALALMLILATSLDATAQTQASQFPKTGLMSAESLVVDSFDSVSQWSTNPAAGVEITVHLDAGRHGRGMRVDFDFHGHTGYGIVHRDVNLEVPANYEFSFSVRGEAPSNTLEFKLVDPTGANVWWSNNQNFVFSPEWRTVARKKGEICFVWGPSNGGEIHRVSAVEFAITAGSGGKGSVWIDDLALTPLDLDSPFDLIAPIASAPIVGTWELAKTSNEGIATRLDFAADGSYTVTGREVVDFAYAVANNRLTTNFKDPTNGESVDFTTSIRIEQDTLTQRGENLLFGKDVSMKRVRPAIKGNDPIVGFWSYPDYTGVPVFVEFAKNGRGLFQLPIGSCSGTWTDAGGGHLTVSLCILRIVPRKMTCSLAQGRIQWDYFIEEGVLTLRNPQGIEAKFNRHASPD